MNPEKTRELNDAFRTTMTGGRVVVTAGVNALPPGIKRTLIQRVRDFSAFTPDNDPHGEHDFGAITLGHHEFFWKIDYYDSSLEMGSDDPSDPSKTTRVLTLLLAEEY